MLAASKSKICLLWLFLLVSPPVMAQEVPRKYCAHKVSEPVTIDGNGEESAWAGVPWSEDFVDIANLNKPKYQTRVKLIWDDSYLYCLAQLEEKDVWATLKQRDTVIFYNNDFEIFLDPDGDTHNYYELEVNALNTVWDLFLTKPYRNGGTVLDSWDIQGLKSAIQIDGTLNDPSDQDLGWTLEIAIPWVVITEAARPSRIPGNSYWRINFSRVNWDYKIAEGRYERAKDLTGKYLPEYNWVWSQQEVVNMHEPERWGYVYFSTAHPDKPCDFPIPPEEAVKRRMYAIYRTLISSDTALDAARTDPVFPVEIEGRHAKVLFEPGAFGWELHTKSPFSDSVLVITDDGLFKMHIPE